MAEKLNLAYFVTPHGYGHAARACAVMQALRELAPETHFEIFTRTPAWFFEASLAGGFTYHKTPTDIGIAQDSAMDENLPKTVRLLGELLPFREDFVQSLAGEVVRSGCRLVVCDIAPLGIAVARQARLPSVLIENFTWDWIYAGYLDEEPRLAPFIAYLKDAFSSADHHIRAEPSCSDELPADLSVPPVGREPRTSIFETRARLGLPPDAPLTLVTMGGIGASYPFLDRLAEYSGAFFLIPGASDALQRRGSLVMLPHHSEFYHPDLMAASNAVVGKLGYSTLAEAYLTGRPYAFIPRPRFRESEVMGRFVLQIMNGIEIPEDVFFSGGWLDAVPTLLSRPHRCPPGPTGAEQAAAFLHALLHLA